MSDPVREALKAGARELYADLAFTRDVQALVEAEAMT
jgi:hypothetical protein